MAKAETSWAAAVKAGLYVVPIGNAKMITESCWLTHTVPHKRNWYIQSWSAFMKNVNFKSKTTPWCLGVLQLI